MAIFLQQSVHSAPISTCICIIHVYLSWVGVVGIKDAERSETYCSAHPSGAFPKLQLSESGVHVLVYTKCIYVHAYISLFVKTRRIYIDTGIYDRKTENIRGERGTRM